MDGVLAVSARISEIRALMAPSRPAVVATAAPPQPGAAAAATPGGSGASFSAALAEAVAAPARPQTSIAALKAAYANGRVPAAALTPIGRGDHRLAAPAAAAFQRLEQAALRDGVTIGVTDSYRSYDAQVDVAARKGLYSRGGLAAEPGTSSHGYGLAVDLDLDAPAQAWMRANAGRFGFVEDTPREPWHWAYQSS